MDRPNYKLIKCREACEIASGARGIVTDRGSEMDVGSDPDNVLDVLRMNVTENVLKLKFAAKNCRIQLAKGVAVSFSTSHYSDRIMRGHYLPRSGGLEQCLLQPFELLLSHHRDAIRIRVVDILVPVRAKVEEEHLEILAILLTPIDQLVFNQRVIFVESLERVGEEAIRGSSVGVKWFAQNLARIPVLLAKGLR
jgi:hypothetical protein